MFSIVAIDHFVDLFFSQRITLDLIGGVRTFLLGVFTQFGRDVSRNFHIRNAKSVFFNFRDVFECLVGQNRLYHSKLPQDDYIGRRLIISLIFHYFFTIVHCDRRDI